MPEIGRKRAFGLGIESTPGTSVSAAAWFPVEKGSLKHVIEKVKDTNGMQLIDEVSDSHITMESSEFQMEGIARSQSLGYLLKMALGTAGAATLVETGVYSHAFTRLNTNAHPSATVYADDGVADEKATYHMLDTLDLDMKVGEFVNFSATTKGTAIVSGSSTPSFLTGTSDEQFLASKATIKVATDIAGLSGASAITLEGIKLSIKKNVVLRYKLGQTAPQLVANQQFTVSGDFEALHADNTYRDIFTGNTKKAIQIQIDGKTLIGATEYNSITIQIAKVNLSSWDRSDGNNDLVNETVGFDAEYSFSDTQTMNISLQNTKTSAY